MRALSAVGPALIAGGAAAVAAAVATGGARAGIVVVFPVIFGSSALFLAGVLLLIVGIFSIPFTLGVEGVEPRDPGNVTAGGLVLVGPVPIFWGSASHASRRARILAAAAGGLLLIVAVVLLVGWVR
jgi:uncharacterized membrane protein